jgi:hypothetical protein
MDKYQLPWWMQWLQAMAVLVIAAAGVWIAYRQATIAQGKLKLDRFDKRFAVFNAARNALVSVLQHGDINHKVLDTYNLGVVDAVFLFDDSMEAYLEDLRKRLAQLQFVCRQLDNENLSQERRTQLADRRTQIFENLQKEFDVLKEKFKPFLQLGAS